MRGLSPSRRHPPGIRSRPARFASAATRARRGPPDGGSIHEPLKDAPGNRAGCLACHDPHVSAQPRLLELPAGRALRLVPPGAERGREGRARLRPGSRGLRALSRPSRLRPQGAHARRGERRVPRLPQAEGRQPREEAPPGRPGEARLPGVPLLFHGDCQPKSLAKVVHPPLLDGCDACHEGGRSSTLASGGGPDLCESCHDGVLRAARALPVRHAAMDAGSCRACHSPHAASRRFLMRSPPESPCGACHPAQLAGAGESAHDVIRLLGCEVCHQPHGGSSRRLLRETGAKPVSPATAPRPFRRPAEGRLRSSAVSRSRRRRSRGSRSCR